MEYMTIDRSIEKLTHEKQCFIDEGWEDTGELEAYDTAISIMRKYQKIEDIYYHQSGEALENSLRAVIEDGNE